MSENHVQGLPIQLFDLATGYQRAKTLFALVEFEIPTLLASRSMPLADIAETVGIHPRAADRFLNACVGMGLLERIEGNFRNAAIAERFLVKGKTTYLGDQFLRYDRTSYPLWANLTYRMREWEPGTTDDQVPEKADQGADSMRDQHNLAILAGRALAESFDFGKYSHLLDLGGGTAAMSIAVCERYESIRSTVFDLPSVCDVAREFIKGAGLDGRIKTEQGNFKTDPLPVGFDVALLANLLSVASEETNRDLLSRVYSNLPTGGTVILSGWILNDDKTGPLITALFCLEDINWQAPDVERTASTYKGWLSEAGFVDIDESGYFPPTSMIVGRKRT